MLIWVVAVVLVGGFGLLGHQAGAIRWGIGFIGAALGLALVGVAGGPVASGLAMMGVKDYIDLALLPGVIVFSLLTIVFLVIGVAAHRPVELHFKYRSDEPTRAAFERMNQAIGLFVGLAGGSFSVGTPYVARWFPKQQQGMAMGIYGAGNSGSAVNKFVAPVILVAFGWAAVPQVYAAIMAGTVVLFWLFSHSDPSHLVPSNVKFTDQLKALKDPKVLKYCQYYSIVFGGYVALALWMVQYYVGEYGLDIRIAALLAACFSLPGGVLRAIGGGLSDKYGAHQVTWWVMWVSWICLFLLSYPQTDFTILTANGPRTFHIGLNVYTFTALMAVLGVAFAFGKASVFKYISDDYPQNIGAISGIVGLAGGLGGFVLPILFGVLMDLTGIRSSAFMLLYGVVWVSLVWMYFTEVRRTPVMGADAPASPALVH